MADTGDDSELPPHTQFLDLTNGKGGDLGADSRDSEAAGLPPVGGGDDEEDDGGGMDTSTRNASAAGGSGSGQGVIDPDTPGTVVESGQEHTGRWTREEHEAFLEALNMYGKEWKKVAAKVKTRTVVQTRTHAQKYFQKLHKAMESSGRSGAEVTQVDMGVASDSKKGSAQKRKKTKIAGQAATPPSIASATKQNRRGSAATLNAAQLISGLSHSQPDMGGTGAGYVGIGSSTVMGQAPRHGFSAPAEVPSFGCSSYFGANSNDWISSGAVKIIAPDPTEALRRGGFPEPSPAATGKRKLAEIAAARMLAGVAGVSGQQQQQQPQQQDREGAPTPPPPPPVNIKDAPLPPLFTGGEAPKADSAGVFAARKGLSLQIVNPESLGVTVDTKRKHDGEASPVTPWDGQLEALVTETKAKTTEDGDMKMPAVNGAKAIIHPVCDPTQSYDRTPLHQSICDMDLHAFQEHLSVMANLSEGDLQRPDEAGYFPIHTACSLPMAHPDRMDQAREMVRLLVEAGADPLRKDASENTPLHWAARAGDRQVVELLLSKNAPQDAKNKAGETALHWAMRVGKRGMDVVNALLDNGARPSILNNDFRRPIDVAGDGFLDEAGSLAALRAKDQLQQRKNKSREHKKALKETAGGRREARANLLIHSPQSRTLVLHHPECNEHIPKSEHDWEAPDRVTSIMRRVIPSSDATGSTETSGIFPYEVTVSKEFERARLDLLSRIHTAEYLSFVNELSKDMERQLKEAEGGASQDEKETESTLGSPPVVPFTPMVQRTMIKIDESSVKLGHNSDTSFSAGSLKAARRAAGAVQHAVDCVLVGRNRNAFCAVRPPGHHAGSNGLLEGGESCGFCIFNNVAAGAMYAISDDRLLCDRCAIVDIDVHHGNGTEEIVQKCHDPSKLLFFSVHLYDNDRRKARSSNAFQYKFYPGTGAQDDLAMNIINVPIAPLWKEPIPSLTVASNNASSGPAARKHNTRQRKTRGSQDSGVEDASVSDVGTPRADREDYSSRPNSDIDGSESGSMLNASIRSSPSKQLSASPTSAASGRHAYRQAIQSRLLPALRAFNPDLILISAGFDAGRGDVGNARHEHGGKEQMGIDLDPEDYAWTTRKICEIADICCQGRVVSVLEGGYGRTPPGETTALESEHPSLDRTVFAECAIRHLQALIDPYNSEHRFG